jgi:hypothetical protein
LTSTSLMYSSHPRPKDFCSPLAVPNMLLRSPPLPTVSSSSSSGQKQSSLQRQRHEAGAGSRQGHAASQAGWSSQCFIVAPLHAP